MDVGFRGFVTGLAAVLAVVVLAAWAMWEWSSPGKAEFVRQPDSSPLPAPSDLPESLVSRERLIVFSYDSLPHRDAKHYVGLALAVQGELGLQDTAVAVPVRLIFMDSGMRDRLGSNNGDLIDTAQWVGYCLSPCILFVVGEYETDDTFMHEYMHMLAASGKIFRDIDPRMVHPLIYLDERLMLGSRRYLQFVRSEVPR